MHRIILLDFCLLRVIFLVHLDSCSNEKLKFILEKDRASTEASTLTSNRLYFEDLNHVVLVDACDIIISIRKSSHQTVI